MGEFFNSALEEWRSQIYLFPVTKQRGRWKQMRPLFAGPRVWSLRSEVRSTAAYFLPHSIAQHSPQRRRPHAEGHFPQLGRQEPEEADVQNTKTCARAEPQICTGYHELPPGHQGTDRKAVEQNAYKPRGIQAGARQCHCVSLRVSLLGPQAS